MAITINWDTKVITVPKADTTLIQSTPTEIRQLNLDTFRLILKDLEDDPEGMPFLKTHNNNPPVTVGGVVLARVVEIINGYTVTFEDGQYAVNLVGANSNVGDVVNVNQVSVRTANSAGLQDLSTILSAAYNGEICISSSGQSGTDVPVGTRSTPVDNIPDALVLAAKEGANTLRFLESFTLSNVTIPQGTVITSDNPAYTTITIDPSATVSGTEYVNVGIQGTADGDNIYRQCILYNVSYTSGFVFQCSINNTIIINGGQTLAMLDCFSNTLAGQPSPVIDFGGNGRLILRNYAGGIEIKNHTDNTFGTEQFDGDLCLDFNSGVLIIDETFTAGYIPVRGICRVVNNSTGTTVVADETINNLVNKNAADLDVINVGVQKASLLIPHTANLPT